MTEIKWKNEDHKRHAEEHWGTVPSYSVADPGDTKVDEHPLKGVAIFD